MPHRRISIRDEGKLKEWMSVRLALRVRSIPERAEGDNSGFHGSKPDVAYRKCHGSRIHGIILLTPMRSKLPAFWSKSDAALAPDALELRETNIRDFRPHGASRQ